MTVFEALISQSISLNFPVNIHTGTHLCSHSGSKTHEKSVSARLKREDMARRHCANWRGHPSRIINSAGPVVKKDCGVGGWRA